MVDKIRRVLPQEGQRFAALLTLAMAADPTTRWAAPDSLQYLNLSMAMISRFTGRIAIDDGTADVIGDFRGAALWHSPGVSADIVAAHQLLSEFMPAEQMERVATLFAAMSDFHPREPHWHLRIIGVDPMCRNRGLGRKLMQHRLGLVDRERGLAYLEATSERSSKLYREFGFEIIGEISVPGSPKMFPMLRRPVHSKRI